MKVLFPAAAGHETQAFESQLVMLVLQVFCRVGVDLHMEVNTASPVYVISRDVYNQCRHSSSSLQSTRLKLSCYVGKLPVWGKLALDVPYNGRTAT